MHLIGFLIVGLVAGWLAGKLMHGGGFGFWGDLIVGVIGAFVGGFLFRLMGWGGANGGLVESLLVAVVGAVVLLFAIRLIKSA